ncbi:hypothetical protein ACTNEM_07185 [Eubacterium pyruvativorans]|uniref:hypothetical protein n=1 Tax=Eubacterium pyruvativorans TaxID=155865 RepID=UPI003F886005
MVKSSKKVLAVLLAVACLITFMPAMASQSFAAKKLTVKPAKKTIYVKKSVTLKANQKVKWSASKASLKVVKLTSKKAKSVKVTGKKAGKAVVTAKVGKQTKKVTITVKKAKAAVKKTAVTAVAVTADNSKVAVNKVVTIGEVLRANVTPEDATVTYQWLADGTPIEGATKASFTVGAAQTGKAISVKVTGTGNFDKEVTSEATAKVAASKLTSVTVKGSDNKPATTAVVGDTLTAEAAGTYVDNNGASQDIDLSNAVTYQWFRGAVAADKAIAGATSKTYKVADADAGYNLIVVATPQNGVNGYAVNSSAVAVSDTANATLSIKADNAGLHAVVKDKKGVEDTTLTGYEFQWAKSTDGKAYTAVSGATNSVFNTDLTADNYYQVTVTKTATGVVFASKVATIQYTGKFLKDCATVRNNTSALAIPTRSTNITGDVLEVTEVKNTANKDLTYGTDYTVSWYRTASTTTTLNPVTAVALGTSQTYALASSDANAKVWAVVTGAGAYAGQTQTVEAVSTNATANTALTLTYDGEKLTVKDGDNVVTDATIVVITAPSGAFDGTLKRVKTVNEAALQGTSLYVVTKKDSAVTARSNKITFDGAGHATTSPLTAADIQTAE